MGLNDGSFGQTAGLVRIGLGHTGGFDDIGTRKTGRLGCGSGAGRLGFELKLFCVGQGLDFVTFGVSGFLAQPVLTVFNSSNTAVASNAGWGNAPNPALISSVAQAVGAFSLGPSSLDSALLLTLQPGSYSAQVAGANGTTGIALVEVYQAPPQ